MKKRNQALEPLMFIEQQNDKVPESIMQQTYSSIHDQNPANKQHSEDNTHNTNWKSHRRFIRNIAHEQDIAEDVQSETESEEEIAQTETEIEGEEEVSEQIKDQTFADLTIEQKVLYCTSTSSYIPNIICIVKTDSQTIVGAIRKYEDGIVHIKPQRSKVFTKIPFEEILSIRMAGF